MNFILDFFKNNRTLGIALGVAAASLLLNLKQCSRTSELRKEVKVANQNINALNDTIRVTKDKAGQAEYNKLSLLTDKVSNLEKLSADLYAEVKKLKGKPATIIKGDVVVVHDTVPLIVKGEVIGDVVHTPFNFDSTYSEGNYRKLAGYTKYNLKTGEASGLKTVDEFGIRLVTGIKNLDKGKPEIFFKSAYPGFSVTALEGAVLDPKLFSKKKVPLITGGISIGWTPTAYDLNTKKFDFKPTRFGVNAGININVLKLLRK